MLVTGRPGYYARKKKSSKPIADPTIGMDPSITQVWTDGSASPNPGPGGWGWVTPDGRQGMGGSNGVSTTNQRMEITAATQAILSVGERPLAIITDSSYVRDGVTSWYRGWLRENRWTNSSGQPVANRDLWEPLFDLAIFGGVTYAENPDRVAVKTGIEVIWVKAHVGFELNEAADTIANAGRALRY